MYFVQVCVYIQVLYAQMAQQYIRVHSCYWSLHVHYTIGFTCSDCGMYMHVDFANLQITFTSMLMYHNITTDTVPLCQYILHKSDLAAPLLNEKGKPGS